MKGEISIIYYIEALYNKLRSYIKASNEWSEQSRISRYYIYRGYYLKYSHLTKIQQYDTDLGSLKD